MTREPERVKEVVGKVHDDCCHDHSTDSGAKKKSFAFGLKGVVFVLGLVLVAFVLGNYATTGKIALPIHKRFESEDITPQQLVRALENKDFTLINVHTPYEGEIKNTDMFIEYDSLVANKAKLPQEKDAKIVLYCKSGNMSAKALKTLKSLGYTNVTHLAGGFEAWEKSGNSVLNLSSIPQKVTPQEGFELDFSLGDLGPKLIESGVIDLAKFKQATKMSQKEENILMEGSNENLEINPSNAHFMVNILWALGLAQKSLVYDIGPMGTQYKDKAGNFASTGGWTLARGEAVDYLNKFDLISLNESQQQQVYEIAQNVYRPCCGNATSFPDCNHGMAALAAIEIMVSQGLSEDKIYENLLKLNSFWFPSTYLAIATYFERQETPWESVDAKLVLGQDYSSGQGAANIYKQVGTLPYEATGGGSCGA